ncbi:hypothetical protein [Asticcacaulis sp. MM231]|uniref:hypothetical protein n=1 Tax=Asticcacaulis sp. MM231 TaxID=3157666 RepID=UPI0032D58631
MAKFGNWSDIDRIKKLGDYVSDRSHILSLRTTKMPVQKAKAILAIGATRIADVLDVDLEMATRRAIAYHVPKKSIADLGDEVLLRELSRDDDKYRVIFGIRCVLSLPKSRVSALLKRYVNRDAHRYYNSIHWLDLGASIPQALARIVAQRELQRYDEYI